LNGSHRIPAHRAHAVVHRVRPPGPWAADCGQTFFALIGSHPSMISIPKSEYARRRKALMAQMEPNSIAILPAAPVYIRNRDVEQMVRQVSELQYLCGFHEPETVIALIPGREHGEYLLSCRERVPERELWDGLRAGQDGAVSRLGAADACPIGDIDDILPGRIEGR